MRRHIKTIRFQLFLYYSIMAILLFLILTGVIYVYVSGILSQRAEDALMQLVRSHLSELDNQIRVMNETSIRVAYSNLVKQRFDSYRTIPEPISNYYDQQALRDIFIAIMGPLRSVHQINLYDFTGTVVGAGYRSYSKTIRVAGKEWYAETMALEGGKFLTAPFFDDETGTLVLGLNRVYYDNTTVAVGVIETLQKYEVLFATFADSDSGGIYVFGPRRQLLYPLKADLSAKDRNFVAQVLDMADNPPERNPYSHDEVTIAFATSEYTGCTVLIAEPARNLRLPVRSFSRLVFILLAVFLSLALLTSFLLARKLTLPIDRIHSDIKQLDYSTFPRTLTTSLGSNFNELEDLHNSFKEMGVRLKKSMDDLITAKSQELNARLLALQSQMNPHFLYNTLSTISVLAEDEKSEDIVGICDYLSSMLRYVSSEAAELVPVSLEMDHTLNYLRLMKYRYEQKIDYRFDVPTEMQSIPVPKLIVQPLVENSMKYGIHTAPPWKISIRGIVEDNSWRVEVRDNGPGFDRQKIVELRARMESMAFDQVINSLHVEGMGLMNIFARLSMLYAENAVFILENGPSGGAVVIIGGSAS